MGERIILILFALLSCFSLYACSEWIIIEDTTVEDQYFYDQFLQLRKKHLSDPLNLDTFTDKTSEELENICLPLKNSKIYKRIPLTLQFPEPSYLERIGESKGAAKVETNYRYTSRPFKLNNGEIIGEISVFPCQTHPRQTYWLTYGYTGSSIFLLQEVHGGKAVSFVGLSVKVPTIDEKYPYKGETLENYFWLTVEKAKNSGFANLFTHSSQFYLCCMVHAARQRTHPGKKSFTLNYANNDAFTTDWPPMNKKITNSEYKKINLRSIGCAINRQEAEMDFCIRADTEDPTALFVLEQEEETLVVSQHIVEIPSQCHYSFRYS